MCSFHCIYRSENNYTPDSFFKKLEIIGFFCVSISGALLHFAYEFFNYNPFVGLFAPVNESTFEHLKLLLYPMLVCSIVQYYILKKRNYENLNSFICANTIGIISGIISIVVLFYTYIGVLGFNVDFINIAIYYISVLIAFYLSYMITTKKKQDNHCQICLQILTILVILFLLFTIYPANIGLFREP